MLKTELGLRALDTVTQRRRAVAITTALLPNIDARADGGDNHETGDYHSSHILGGNTVLITLQ